MKELKLGKGLKIVLLFLGLFLLFNVFWLIAIYTVYKPLSDSDMEVHKKFATYVKKEDEYYFNVQYPSYPSFTGNLCVEDMKTKHTLFIWPALFGEDEYGMQIYQKDGEVYSIMINKLLEPIESQYKEIIDEHKENIETLYEKATQKWGKYL